MDPTRAQPPETREVAGVIREMDPASRLVTLLVGDGVMELVVPPDCPVRLNGERVKLRLLQAGDRAEAGYSLVRDVPVAHSLRVPGRPRVVGAAGSGQPKPPGNQESVQ